MKTNILFQILLVVILTCTMNDVTAQSYLNFDGVNDRVDIPMNGTGVLNNYATRENFTIETKMRFHASPRGAVFAKHRCCNAGFVLETSGNKFSIAFVSDTYINYGSAQGTTSIVVGQWYNVSVTYNDATYLAKLYINGVHEATFDMLSSMRFNSTHHFTLVSSE